MIGRGMRAFASIVKGRRHPLPKSQKPSINPRVPIEEAEALAGALFGILKASGPLRVQDCWNQAQSTPGFKSKRHMKVILRWMKERNRVKTVQSKYHSMDKDDDEDDEHHLYAANCIEKEPEK